MVTAGTLSVITKEFTSDSPNWRGDVREYNELYLRTTENWANDSLRLKGYFFLNELYSLLGFPITQEGAVSGWTRPQKITIGKDVQKDKIVLAIAGTRNILHMLPAR